MAALEKGTLFAPVLVTDLVNKVKGKSSLAKLSGYEPIPFSITTIKNYMTLKLGYSLY